MNMEITSVKYKTDSIKVIFENGNFFILPITSEYMKLSLGNDISNEIIVRMKSDSAYFLCRQQLYKYLANADKSIFECKSYLQRKKFEDKVILTILDEFREKNYLNDAEHVRKYLDFLKRTKTAGKNFVLNRLYMKDIDKSIIESFMDEIKLFDENYDEILKLAEKKYKIIGEKNNNYSKLVYFLQSRGFSNQTIFKVLDMMKNRGYIFYKSDDNNYDDD